MRTGRKNREAATCLAECVSEVLERRFMLAAQQVQALATDSAPVVTVSLSALSPDTNDTLTATATKSDADGDPVSLTFVWKVDGVIRRTFTSATALSDTFDLSVAGNGDKGQNVSVEVTPNATPVVPVARWGFEEGTPGLAAAGNGSIIDSAGTHNGTAFGSPVYGAASSAMGTVGLRFDANNDRVAIPDSPEFVLTRSLTLEANIYLDRLAPSFAYNQIIFRGDDRPGYDPYMLGVSSSTGKLSFRIDSSSGVSSEILSSDPLPVQTWLHVAGTLDDTTGIQSLYVNGQRVASRTTALRPLGNLNSSYSPGLGIGDIQSEAYNERFAGTIADVAISDAALIAGQFVLASDGTAGGATVAMTAIVVDSVPTAVVLSATNLAADSPVGTTVATLSTIDPDAADTFTYTLVEGAGSDDNAAFTISGNQLRTATTLTRERYTIRLRATDASGLFTEQAFTITATDLRLPLSIHRESRWGGAMHAVAVQGSVAYVSQGQDLVAMDISSPASPRELGRTTMPSPGVRAAVSGNHVYVATHTGLAIIDITNPSAPVCLAGYTLSSWSGGVAAAGNYAYLARNDYGLEIIDVSNPSAPVAVGRYDTPGSAWDVAVAGAYAYVADLTAGLQIVNISNPFSPVLAGSYDTPGLASGIAVVGNYAYIADSSAGGFRVVDIRTPSAPVSVGALSLTGGADDIEVAGAYAYVTGFGGGLQVINISTPSSLALTGRYVIDGAHYLAVSGNHAYVSAEWSGLHIVDISSPASPSQVGEYRTGGYVNNVTVDGNYAYVAAGYTGLQILDISDPSVPVWLSTIDTSNSVSSTAVAGHYAYIASGVDGLLIYDISTPATPVKVGACSTSGAVQDVVIVGNYAYVTNASVGLQVIDIRNPSAPAIVGSYAMADGARDVCIVGTYAYVTEPDFGLRILSINNPTTPALVGSYDTPGYAFRVTVLGNLAYVADGYNGLHILDVSDPSMPVRIGGDSMPGIDSVVVVGNYAWVTRGDAGLRVLDITSPSAPVLVRTYGTVGWASQVTIAGNDVYVSADRNGLVVLRVEQDAPPAGIVLSNDTVAENLSAGTPVGRFTAIDSNPEDTITYSLVSGTGDTDNAGFSIAGDQLKLMLRADYESKRSYSIRARATDTGGLWYEQAFTIAVSDANDAPVLAPIANQNIAEGSSLSFTATVADVDLPAQTLTFSLLNAPAGAAIDATTGRFSWTPSETQGLGTYRLTIRVSDGSLSAEQSFQVMVTPANTAPTLANASFTLPEHATIGALLGTLAAANPDAGQSLSYAITTGNAGNTFALDAATGQLTLAGLLDYEACSSYSLTVRVTDNGSPALSATATVTIAVTDVNEAPSLTPISNQSVAEGRPLAFNATASDPDLPAQTLVYRLLGEVPSGVRFDPATALFSWTPSEAQGPGTYPLTIEVSDGLLSDSRSFQIRVGEVNTAPGTLIDPLFAIPENQPLGTLVGTLIASDADLPANPLTYTITAGNEAGCFALDAATGRLTLTGALDYEARASYHLSIYACDNGSPALGGSAGLLINVTDLPEFGRQQGKLQVASVRDRDGDLVSFALSGGGSGTLQPDHSLTLSGTTAKSVLSIRVKKAKSGDGYYALTGIASDGLLQSLAAAKVDLSGAVALNTLVHDAGSSTLTIRLAGVRDSSIDTHGLPIRALKLLDWQDTDGTADQVLAPWIGSITVSGRKENPRTAASELLAGDWQADVLTSASNAGVALSSLKVAGSIAGAQLWASGSIRSVYAKGTLAGSRVAAAAGIGSLSVAELHESAVLVGVSPEFGARFASSAEDFADPAAKLGSLSVRGRMLPKGQVHPEYVSNSQISAPRYGTLSLVNVPLATGELLHVLSDTGVLKVKSLSAGMVLGGTWKGGVTPRPGQTPRPGLVEVVG